MAVVKISSNGKSVTFITDEGEQFITSTNFLMGLLMGKSKTGFILLTRLAQNCAPGRFMPSPLYDPRGVFKNLNPKTLDVSNDPYSKKGKEEMTAPEEFKDKAVW
jgi:hypothetical protein